MNTKYKELTDLINKTIEHATLFELVSIVFLTMSSFASVIILSRFNVSVGIVVAIMILSLIPGVIYGTRLIIATCQVFLCLKDTADYAAETNERVLYLCRVAEFYGKREQK